MTREEKQKAIDALRMSAPIMVMTQEEFNDYIQTLNKVMDWLEQEPTTKDEHHRQNIQAYAHDFGVSEEQAEKELRVTTKNDLVVDKLISDCEKMSFDMEIFNKPLKVVALDAVKNIVKDLPPVTPQPMVIPIAEAKIDEDKLKELANRAVLTVIPQEPILDKIWRIVYPLSIMSTDKMEHEAIMKITEMLDPLHWSEEEVNE